MKKRLGVLKLGSSSIPVFKVSEDLLSTGSDGEPCWAEFDLEDRDICLNKTVSDKGFLLHILIHELGHAALRTFADYHSFDGQDRLYNEEAVVDGIGMGVAQNWAELARILKNWSK